MLIELTDALAFDDLHPLQFPEVTHESVQLSRLKLNNPNTAQISISISISFSISIRFLIGMRIARSAVWANPLGIGRTAVSRYRVPNLLLH